MYIIQTLGINKWTIILINVLKILTGQIRFFFLYKNICYDVCIKWYYMLYSISSNASVKQEAMLQKNKKLSAICNNDYDFWFYTKEKLFYTGFLPQMIDIRTGITISCGMLYMFRMFYYILLQNLNRLHADFPSMYNIFDSGLTYIL